MGAVGWHGPALDLVPRDSCQLGPSNVERQLRSNGIERANCRSSDCFMRCYTLARRRVRAAFRSWAIRSAR